MRRSVRENAVTDALAQRAQELSSLHIDDLVIFIVGCKARVMSPERDSMTTKETDQPNEV